MEERDAKWAGLEVHRREMAFVHGYVTCTSCACNYNASALDRREPIFCQMYSIPINPGEIELNIERAEGCRQYVHEGMDRSKVVTPDHAYRYDRWGD